MNPDEDFTAVSVQNTFPIDLKGCVGDDQHMKYLTFSPKQMSSSVKFISTQRTFIPSEAEDLNSLSTLGCSQSNDWKKVTIQKVTHQHADAIVHYILVTLKNNYALVFLCL